MHRICHFRNRIYSPRPGHERSRRASGPTWPTITPWMALTCIGGTTVYIAEPSSESSLSKLLQTSLPARWQSERRSIDRPSYWSPAASYQRIMAPLNIPCSRCPGFCRQVHAQHHQHGAHGAMAAHKALSHAPRTQTRSRTRLHMQHTVGLMRELIAVGIRDFCEQWATDAFVTPWASTEPRFRIGWARDGPSGRPFGQCMAVII